MYLFRPTSSCNSGLRTCCNHRTCGRSGLPVLPFSCLIVFLQWIQSSDLSWAAFEFSKAVGPTWQPSVRYSRAAAADCRVMMMILMMSTSWCQQTRLTVEYVGIAGGPWQRRRRRRLNSLCKADKVEPVCIPFAVHLN